MSALQELATDSNSYMEPEDDDLLPDGDVCVAESSNLFSVATFCYNDNSAFMHTITNFRV